MRGIADVRVLPEKRDTQSWPPFFAHTRYWKARLEWGQQQGQIPHHIRELRDAIILKEDPA